MENLTKAEIKYCFLDTNLLLHFQTFDEIDWCSILQADKVFLVLAPVVMRELNQHKDNSSNEWRQKRARMLLSKLKKLLRDTMPGDPVLFQEGVSILEVPREPVVDWITTGLDPMINDDRLLASIIEFANAYSPDTLLLFSDDFPVQRRAALYGIEVMEPEEIIKPLERPSSQASRIEALQRELDAMRNQFAKLDFSFWEEGAKTNKVLRQVSASKPRWPSDDNLAKTIAEKEQKLEQIINRARRNRIEEKNIEDFIKDYRKFIDWLQRSIKEKRSREFGPWCDLVFFLHNKGSVPALDVSISLYFPDGFFVVGNSKSDMWDKARLPNEPEPEWEKVKDYLSSLIAPQLKTPTIEPKPRGPLYDFKYRSEVSYEYPKFRQKDSWIMPGIRAYLDPAVKGGFQIRYFIEADNMPDPIEGVLNVVLKQE